MSDRIWNPGNVKKPLFVMKVADCENSEISLEMKSIASLCKAL